MCGFISGLSILFHRSICLMFIEKYECSSCVLFEDCFGYSEPLAIKLNMNLRIIFSVSVERKKGCWNLDKDCVASVERFG